MAAVPERPLGITAISVLLLLGALAMLARTLNFHVGGLAGFGRMVAVLAMLLISAGLWIRYNAARILLFFLLVSDVIGCVMAIFLYALRQSQYRLALFLVIQLC